ncbi:hypothetical protein [Spirosoma pomorum]
MEAPQNGLTTIAGVLNQVVQPQPVFDQNSQPVANGPADGNTSTFIQNFGKFERAGSTYSWKITRPRLSKLGGHSKPLGQPEKPNKQELLKDCIGRLVRKGYLKDGYSITIFRNISDDDSESKKLMTLYDRRFVPEPLIVTEGWLMKYLKDLYNPVVYDYGTSELFPTGNNSPMPDGMAVIPDSSKQAPMKEAFDLERKFKSEDALHDYVAKLTRDGHPKNRIEDYYRKMIQYFHPGRYR